MHWLKKYYFLKKISVKKIQGCQVAFSFDLIYFYVLILVCTLSLSNGHKACGGNAT